MPDVEIKILQLDKLRPLFVADSAYQQFVNTLTAAVQRDHFVVLACGDKLRYHVQALHDAGASLSLVDAVLKLTDNVDDACVAALFSYDMRSDGYFKDRPAVPVAKPAKTVERMRVRLLHPRSYFTEKVRVFVPRGMLGTVDKLEDGMLGVYWDLAFVRDDEQVEKSQRSRTLREWYDCDVVSEEIEYAGTA